MVTKSSSCFGLTPSPRHDGHGLSIWIPSPRQLGQGVWVRMLPIIVCRTWATAPMPLQVAHVLGFDLSAVPMPSHVSHVADRRKVTFFSIPSRTSRRLIEASARMSSPSRTPPRARCCPPPLPKNASKRSPNPAPPWKKSPGLPLNPP